MSSSPKRSRRVDPNLLPSAEELAEIEARKREIQEEHRFRRENNLENESFKCFTTFSPKVYNFSSMRSSHSE